MTTTETPVPPDSPAPAQPSRWRLATAISAAVAAAAIGVAALSLTGDGDGTMMATRDIAAVRQVTQTCERWLDSTTASTTSDASGWCGSMGDWMNDRMAAGQMTGPMMWGDAAAMYETCTQAMRSDEPGVDPAQRCQDMVGWMSQHRAGWMHDWDDSQDARAP